MNDIVDTKQFTPGQVRAAIPEQLNVPDIIHLTGRLTQLLKQELELLKGMKIKAIGELQQEKLFLTSALEGHRKMMKKYPQLKETIPGQYRQELKEAVRVFEETMNENHRRLLIAREVNHRIVRNVTKSMQENAAGTVYDGRGERGVKPNAALSITLNQTA